jgi:Cu(I)/Ag(I) efflux system protein CusF
MKRMLQLGLFGIIGAAVLGTAYAAADGGSVALQLASAHTSQAAPVSAAGVVEQVKPEQDRVKITHDPIPMLGWPKMTMYFRVRDKALLDGITAGDNVRFEMEKDAKGLVITRMEKAAK